MPAERGCDEPWRLGRYYAARRPPATADAAASAGGVRRARAADRVCAPPTSAAGSAATRCRCCARLAGAGGRREAAAAGRRAERRAAAEDLRGLEIALRAFENMHAARLRAGQRVASRCSPARPSDSRRSGTRSRRALAPGGRLAGQLLGPHDSWAGRPGCTVHTRTRSTACLRVRGRAARRRRRATP